MKKVDLKSEAVSARYTNCFRVGHNATEFVLDFGESYDEERETFHTRIVTSPSCAADLLEVLRKSLREHGRTFGCIGGEEPQGTDHDPSDTWSIKKGKES
jgi:hypothetical protein